MAENADEAPLLRLRLQLEMFEHDWTKTKQSLLIRGRFGRLHEPTVGRALWCGGVFLGFGALFIISGFRLNEGTILVCPGLFFLALGYYIAARHLADAKDYAAARDRYELDRQRLVGEIERLGGGEPL